LFGRDSFLDHTGWYVAPTIGQTAVASHIGYLTGLRGAWVVDRTFGIGVAANAFGFKGIEVEPSADGVNRQIAGGYGGVLVQYNFAADELVHAFVDATVGGGAACYHLDSGDNSPCRANAFFIFEPTANLELNVASFVRLAFGGGYRLAATDSDSAIPGSDLSGFVVRTGLEFGRF
jgi:hypothetical protein